MIISAEGQCITARTHPKIVLIQPRFDGPQMVLSAPEMPNIKINVFNISLKPVTKTSVWQQEVQSIDCGDDVAVWLSRYICNDDVGMRLSFYPQTIPTRPVREKNWKFKELTGADSVFGYIFKKKKVFSLIIVFHNRAPFMMYLAL